MNFLLAALRIKFAQFNIPSYHISFSVLMDHSANFDQRTQYMKSYLHIFAGSSILVLKIVLYIIRALELIETALRMCAKTYSALSLSARKVSAQFKEVEGQSWLAKNNFCKGSNLFRHIVIVVPFQTLAFFSLSLPFPCSCLPRIFPQMDFLIQRNDWWAPPLCLFTCAPRRW